MADIDKVAENAWAKIMVRYVVPPISLVFFGLISWLLHDMSSKIDASAARGEVQEMNKALWGAISSHTKAATDLVTSVSVLNAELKAHKDIDDVHETATRDAVNQLRLELARGRPKSEP